MAQAIFKALFVGDVENLKKAFDNVTEKSKKTAKEASGAFSSINNNIGNASDAIKSCGGLFGYLGDTIGGIIAPIKAVGNAMKVAFSANPIGLIVAALAGLTALLTTFFTRNSAAADVFNAKWAWFKGALAGIMDLVSELGRSLYILFTQGWSAFKDSLTGVKKAFDDIGKSAKGLQNIELKKQNLHDFKYGKVDDSKDNGAIGKLTELKLLAEENKLIAKDSAKSDKDRHVAASLALQQKKEILRIIKTISDAEYDIALAEYKNNQSTREDKEKLVEIENQGKEKLKTATTEVIELQETERTLARAITSEIEAQNVELAKQALIKQNTEKQRVSVTAIPTKIDKPVLLPVEMKLLPPIGLVNTFKKNVVAPIKEQTNAMADLISSSMGNVFGLIGESLGQVIAGGNGFSSLLMGLMDLLKGFGSALIAAGIAKISFDKLFGPGGGWIAIGAGVALIAAATAVKSSMQAKNFADGGIVYGETFARVGEYSGASTNPEVIAPLSKLKGILNIPNNQSNSEVIFEIKGQTLVGILNKMNRINTRT